LREDLESFARRESYALSPSDFGQFVRDLLGTPAPAEEEKQKAATPVKRLSGTRAVAAPRAFNEALGGALAALDGDEEDEAAAEVAPAATEENRALGMVTAPGKIIPPAAAPAPRTVALLQPVQQLET